MRFYFVFTWNLSVGQFFHRNELENIFREKSSKIYNKDKHDQFGLYQRWCFLCARTQHETRITITVFTAKKSQNIYKYQIKRYQVLNCTVYAICFFVVSFICLFAISNLTWSWCVISLIVFARQTFDCMTQCFSVSYKFYFCFHTSSVPQNKLTSSFCI